MVSVRMGVTRTSVLRNRLQPKSLSTSSTTLCGKRHRQRTSLASRSWKSPRTSALLNHKHQSCVTTGTNCALRCLNNFLNPLDGQHLFLCVTRKTFTALSMIWVCGDCHCILHDLRPSNKNIDFHFIVLQL